MRFLLFVFASLAVATPVVVERQFGGGQSFACQHDHLHMNPECSKGGSAAKGGKMPGGAGASPKGGLPKMGGS